jgi:hypothetical protein
VSNISATISLPVLTLGLPSRVTGWLLDAGLPVRGLETSLVRRGISPAGAETSIVLFDSRNASARTDAEAAEALGYETIDAARLMSSPAADDDPELTVIPVADPRRRFLDGLRPAIEAAGGLWVRVGDFPHPYRWAVCDESDAAADFDSHREALFSTALAAFADLPSSGLNGRLAAPDWIKACASSGRPLRVPGNPGATLKRYGVKPAVYGLAWQCAISEFATWWRIRRRIAVQVARRGRSLEVEANMPASMEESFVPSLEIWRGRHVAVVPLVEGRAILDDDALPFQSNTSRHHAGFTADAADLDLSAVRERHALPASV